MSLAGFEEFCGSEIWNSSLTLNTDVPRLTLCLRILIRDWLASVILLLILPIYLLFLKVERPIRMKLFPKNKSDRFENFKIIIGLLLTVGYVTVMVYEWSTSGKTVTSFYIITATLRFTSLILSVVLIKVYRKHGQFNSAPLSCYWLLTLLGYSCELYMTIVEYMDDSETSGSLRKLIVAAVMTFLIFVLFFMSCFTDADIAAQHQMADIDSCWYSSFMNIVLFGYIDKLLRKGWKKPLEDDEVWKLKPSNEIANYEPAFYKKYLKRYAEYRKKKEELFEKEKLDESIESSSVGNSDETPLVETRPAKKKKELSFNLLPAILSTWGGKVFTNLLICLFWSLSGFIKPILLKILIELVERGDTSNKTLWQGILISVLFLFTFLLNSMLINGMIYLFRTLRFEIQSSLCSVIFKKALTMRTSEKADTNTGKVVNLMQSDAGKIGGILNYAQVALTAPLNFVLGVLFLYQLLGTPSLYGVAILASVIPITYINQAIRVRVVKTRDALRDERMKIINEVISGIKIVKMYGWEESFTEKVTKVRRKEVRYMEYLRILRAVLALVFTSIPVMVSVVIFWLYSKHRDDHTLSPAIAFVALEYIDIIETAFFRVPDFISNVTDFRVSLGRVCDFLKKTDLDEQPDRQQQESNLKEVHITDGEFGWYNHKSALLKNINFHVSQGQLTGIVGRVAAGKSSLISAITGELHKFKGTVDVKGRIALVSQQSWIFNGTVKDNILFGSDYNEERYNAVLEACALLPDLKVLAAGDRTKIGEQGINLSGGQKQRVSLARAVYSDADIYLLDDPLSAVDSHVGVHLFEKVIGSTGLLKDKTRIMVTHGIRWLPNVDHMVLMRDGEIVDEGSFDKLNVNSEFQQLMNIWQEEEGEESAQAEEIVPAVKPEEITPEVKRVVSEVEDSEEQDAEMEESVETHNVAAKVYWTYLKSMGAIAVSLVGIIIIIDMGMGLVQDLWLTSWTGDAVFKPGANHSNAEKAHISTYYIDGYTGIGIGMGVTSFLLFLFANFAFAISSRRIHGQLFKAIIHSKAWFFDVKPAGLLLNRFGRDMNQIDDQITWTAIWMFYSVVELFGRVSAAGYGLTIMIPVFLVIGTLFIIFQKVYIRTARQLTRLSSRASTPLYVQFTETLRGVQTIRAYQHEERLNGLIEKILNHKFKLELNICAVNRWLGVRMDIATGVVVAGSSLFSILSFHIPFLASSFNAAKAGLVVTLLLNASYNLHGIVWSFSNFETELVSVERVDEYSQVEQEGEYDQPEPPKKWPEKGEIKFVNYQARYRQGLPLVLRSINAEIRPTEKVGIVGTTGAGKSSLTQSLFRLIDAESGSIVIDGINIADIGLKHLRQNLTILPQDPLLFCGSVRDNLDPFHKYNETELWSALEKAHLKDYVKEQSEGLEMECGEGGCNFSVGQRQLMCLARALLRKNKILVLDEATAAVDMQTDKYVQETIRTSFKHCTILTIAHRLNTVIDNDRIMVLNRGKIVEFDTPANLLQINGGYFQSLAKESGITS